MRKTQSLEFLFQVSSLVIALIFVHAFYVLVVRPKAEAVRAEQVVMMQADKNYVQERSVWVVIVSLLICSGDM